MLLPVYFRIILQFINIFHYSFVISNQHITVKDHIVDLYVYRKYFNLQ